MIFYRCPAQVCIAFLKFHKHFTLTKSQVGNVLGSKHESRIRVGLELATNVRHFNL